MNEYAETCKHLNQPEDCQWLQDVHLPHPEDFKSFTLWGNEDAPAAVWLYESRFPLFNSEPAAKYRMDLITGDLVCISH